MLKIKPVEFVSDFSCTYRSTEGRDEDGIFRYNRKLMVSFPAWNCGFAMSVIITDDTDEKKNNVIFDQWYYDKDWPQVITKLAAVNECRGRTAENMAFEIFIEVANDVLDKYFPLIEKH